MWHPSQQRRCALGVYLMGASPARRAAREVVTRVRERDAYAHETLDAVLREAALDSRDTAFATRLAYGTIASRGTLDEIVARYLDRPKALEPAVADALALAAYEVLFFRTPARAAVNEGVELVRSVRPRAAGLANAVLRKLAAAADEFPWSDPETDIAALARLHAHPLWLAELWVRELGRERAARLMAANNEPAPLYLAHLPFRSRESDVIEELAEKGAEPVHCPLPGCIEAGSAPAALASPTLADGRVLVADAAAQFAAHATNASPGQMVVEIGAGRGTKCLIIAGIMHRAGGPNGHTNLIAIDTHGFKLDALDQAVQATGAPKITTVVADATDPRAPGLPAPSSADVVLVDAPCSGLGTLRRHPDRRWRARPDEIETLAVLGKALLVTASELVKPGGFVVYSTCTVAHAENAGVIGGFLASESGRGFEIDPLGGQIAEEWSGFVTPEGFFQSVPEIGGPDGHFVARLVRHG